jgi:hypothetical protein
LLLLPKIASATTSCCCCCRCPGLRQLLLLCQLERLQRLLMPLLLLLGAAGRPLVFYIVDSIHNIISSCMWFVHISPAALAAC